MIDAGQKIECLIVAILTGQALRQCESVFERQRVDRRVRHRRQKAVRLFRVAALRELRQESHAKIGGQILPAGLGQFRR